MKISVFRRKSWLVLGTTLLFSAVAFASPRSDAWKLRATNPEAALSQLQQVVAQDPNDAKAHWFMAMILDDLGRGEEGLGALNNARRIDPALGFASSAGGVANVERSLQRKSGGAASSAPNTSTGNANSGTSSSTSGAPTGSSTFSQSEQQQILSSLQSSGVYVSPGMASVADATALTNAIAGHPHGAKVLVMDTLPRGASIGQFAQRLHGALKMDKGLLVVATGQPRQAAAYGGSLVSSKSDLSNLVKTNAATFTSRGYSEGIAGILAAHKAQEASANRSGNLGLLFLIGVPTAGGVWYFRRKKSVDAARELKLREEARALSNELAPQYEKLDSDFEYAVLGAADNPDKARDLREARATAGAAFSGAMKSFNSAQSFNELVSSRASLIRAKDELVRARAVLEGKPLPVANAVGALGAMNGPSHQANNAFGAGGYGGWNDAQQGVGSMLPPDMRRDQAIQSNGFEIPPLGGGYNGARDGQALDFFTSQPVPINDMVPVDIQIDGEQRRVWASRESAQAAINGNIQIATVNQGGQQVPWYNAADRYNPWQDFGSTMLQMVAINMMMNAMFQPSYGYGGFGHNHYGYDSGWNSGWNHDHGYSNHGGGYSDNSSNSDGGWAGDNSNAGVADLDLFGGGGGGNDSGWSNDSGGSLDLFGGGGGDFGGFGDSS